MPTKTIEERVNDLEHFKTGMKYVGSTLTALGILGIVGNLLLIFLWAPGMAKENAKSAADDEVGQLFAVEQKKFEGVLEEQGNEIDRRKSDYEAFKKEQAQRLEDLVPTGVDAALPSILNTEIPNIAAQVFEPGMIIPYLGNTPLPPSGWLYCNGDIVSAENNPKVAELVALLRKLDLDTYADPSDKNNEQRARVPDLRGVFLRGAGHNESYKGFEYTNDIKHQVGQTQLDGVGNHVHKQKLTQFEDSGTKDLLPFAGRVDGEKNTFGEHEYNRTSGPVSDNPPNETRPKNMAVDFIIKL